jgi:hypothetical protein
MKSICRDFSLGMLTQFPDVIKMAKFWGIFVVVVDLTIGVVS